MKSAAAASNRGTLWALLITGMSAVVAVTCSAAQEPAKTSGTHGGGPAEAHTDAHGVAPPLPSEPPAPAPSASAEQETPSRFSGPLARFHGALSALERRERSDHVRVLWIGDSHAAADFWSGAVRSALQKRFGRGGPGYVYLGYKGYRHDGVGLEVEGKWATQPKSPATSKPVADGAFGLGGVLLRGIDDQPRVALTLSDLDPSTKLSWDLCYKLDAQSDELAVTLGGSPRQVLKPTPDAPVGPIRHLVLSTQGPAVLKIAPTSGQPELCGVVIESDPSTSPGVVLDVVGINGARYATVLAWSEAHWATELRRRRPDLVLLEFGTNEASDENANPVIFGRLLEQLVSRIRKTLPDADCGVLAPTDRADAEERMGPMRDALRTSAAASGCWFFDTYDAMGGQGAARRWRDETPPRAAKDGVHLTAKGYLELGGMLSEALLREFVRDARR